MDGVPELVDFLSKIAAGGIVGVFIAFLLEHVKWFQNLGPEAKKWLVLAIHLLLPLIAAALLKFVPAYVWVELEPFWKALALGFVAWLGSQIAHTWDKTQRKPPPPKPPPDELEWEPIPSQHA